MSDLESFASGGTLRFFPTEIGYDDSFKARRLKCLEKTNYPLMIVKVNFFSYFKDVTGASEVEVELPKGSTIAELQHTVFERYPKLEGMKRSTLIAVGVEYQKRDYVLEEGDRVSFFPPVQGG